MPAYYDEKRKHWRWRYRGRICGIKVCLSGSPAVNTKRAAEQDERLAIERKRKELESPILAREIPTFADYAPTFQARKAKDWGKSTAILKGGFLRNHILPVWGPRRLNEPGKADFQAWIDDLIAARNDSGQRLHSDGLVRGLGSTVKSMLRCALGDELIVQIPVLKLPPEPRREGFLTEEEIQLLINTSTTTEELLIVTLGARAGLRAGEIRGLRLEDWHPESRSLRILRQITVLDEVKAPKAEKTRVVPVHADLGRALAQRAQEATTNPYVLPGRGDGFVPPRRINTVLARMATRAGLDPDKVHAHMLRHSCASHMAIRGVSLYQIMSILGHSRYETTQRYAKLAPSANVAAIDVIPPISPC